MGVLKKLTDCMPHRRAGLRRNFDFAEYLPFLGIDSSIDAAAIRHF